MSAAAHSVNDADGLVETAIDLVSTWLKRADELETADERATMAQLEGVIVDPDGVDFVMRFVDRVVRPDDNRVAADQLASIVADHRLPGFLSTIDRTLLRAGAKLGPILPGVVMPLARRRMRSIVGHLVAPAEPGRLEAHLAVQREHGYALNVNLLGEAVLGEREATRRLDELLAVVDQPDVDYVSVKVSAVASQLNHFAHEASLARIIDRVRVLIDQAARVAPPTFVNFDMEEYHDLDLTLDAFMHVLGEPEYATVDAGIVLQAYLPDALPAMQRLVAWANERHDAGGGEIKIRLVKGANLAMEQVDAAMHGWVQAPFDTKVETDANYVRCLDWLLQPGLMRGVRLGLASHNLFDIAWTHLLAAERRVSDRVQFEMLQGMAPSHARTVAEATPDAPAPLLLYTPAVRSADFDVAISYLFRRLEENASDDNFLRHLFGLAPGSAPFEEQAGIFRESVRLREGVQLGSRRHQDRAAPPTAPYDIGEPFVNEPDTDPTAPANRAWIEIVAARSTMDPSTPITTEIAHIETVVARARVAFEPWSRTAAAERQTMLHRVALELSNRRGDLIATMMHEANKTLVEADVEVSEAIDFARWYGDRALELVDDRATFRPFGVVAVVPPWNFPVAIPAGGVLASLAAGNAVVFKPAPETPRCAEIVAEACWAAGVPLDALQFVRTPDDEVGARLITSADAVILTGSTVTAELFRSWKPEIRLFAETSGKNAIIITPNADVDLAVADLVASAFGHSGQKCSAASLAILVGDVYDSPRFRRQLVDAVESIDIGPATDLSTTMTPIVGQLNERLERGLTQLDQGERWLVQPQLLERDSIMWSPGVRIGVEPGSWFHRTECFGPVLGLMRADDLEHAIELQNSSDFGLTGGIHSLDPNEIGRWDELVEVGNAYVNRAITGAIVQRQPFGGWKMSSVGPGAKAGGPNYVAQLGSWTPTASENGDDYDEWWRTHFSIDHDPTGLFCEANIFRYRPLRRVLLRIGEGADADDLDLVRRAAEVCGVELVESTSSHETTVELAARLASLCIDRIRAVGSSVSDELRIAAHAAGVHIADQPVTAAGRLELQHYLREQAVSRTLHRFGNLVAS
ncbi:MAG: bifunctional proline dehydrogenase/L-glutamate gamma-semialdehyde dehydrogenase [Acidimicrobiales bacterium]